MGLYLLFHRNNPQYGAGFATELRAVLGLVFSPKRCQLVDGLITHAFTVGVFKDTGKVQEGIPPDTVFLTGKDHAFIG